MGKRSSDLALPEAKRFRCDADDMSHINEPFALVDLGSSGPPESSDCTAIPDMRAVGVELDVQAEFGADDPHRGLERAPIAEQELVCFGMVRRGLCPIF